MVFAGEVSRRRNRRTGTCVVLLDRFNGGGWVDADDRWVTLCDEHGTTCSHETRRTAESFMAVPDEWCEECGQLVDYDRRSYERGWRTSMNATGSGALDNADSRGEPDEWYDGYLDAAAGREKWHLRYCTAHHNDPGGCGEA